MGSDPGTTGFAGLRLLKLIRVCFADRPTVSGNPVIRIGEQESPAALKDYQLEIIQPGETLDIILQITSHGIATQLLAVALQEVDVDNGDSSKPNYIGISSTNLAFVEPLEVDYDSWITNAPVPTGDPLEDSRSGHQIAVAWDLRMLGEQSIEVLGIAYKHENMVSQRILLKKSLLGALQSTHRDCAFARSKQAQRYSTSLLTPVLRMSFLKVSRDRLLRAER